MIKKLFTILFGLFVLNSHAETYKIYVGASAGGPSDVYVRKIAEEAEKLSTDKFVVINRPGADFMVAYQAFLEESKTNPNVLFVSATGTHVSSYIQYADLKLDPLNDTKSVILLIRINFLFVALTDSSINSLSDIHGNLNIAHSGATAPLLISKLKLDPGVRTVSFRNDNDALMALLSKEVPLAQLISNNNLLVAHKDRVKIVGNLDKLGIVAGQGLSVAKDFPEDKLVHLNRLFNNAIKQPAIIDWFAANMNGTKPVGGKPSDYDQVLRNFKSKMLDKQ
jgi:hypothetical protein